MAGSDQPPTLPAEADAPARRSTRERSRTVAMAGLLILATVFAVLNLGEVKVDWIFGSGRAPLIIVIVISLIAGVLITYAAERRSGRRK
jgi:uncharacterized integral membrane protein